MTKVIKVTLERVSIVIRLFLCVSQWRLARCSVLHDQKQNKKTPYHPHCRRGGTTAKCSWPEIILPSKVLLGWRFGNEGRLEHLRDNNHELPKIFQMRTYNPPPPSCRQTSPPVR